MISEAVGKENLPDAVGIMLITHGSGYIVGPFVGGTYVLSNYHYRPQQSWGKVIFSVACVKNSVHMLADTGNKRAVRILLECILVRKATVNFSVMSALSFLLP